MPEGAPRIELQSSEPSNNENEQLENEDDDGDTKQSKRFWSESEDAKLRRMVEEHGELWKLTSLKIPGRTRKQCRERWMEHLDPYVKKHPWTIEEDRIIIEAQRESGNKWAKISKLLTGRTSMAVKNRFNSTLCPRIARYLSDCNCMQYIQGYFSPNMEKGFLSFDVDDFLLQMGGKRKKYLPTNEEALTTPESVPVSAKLEEGRNLRRDRKPNPKYTEPPLPSENEPMSTTPMDLEVPTPSQPSLVSLLQHLRHGDKLRPLEEHVSEKKPRLEEEGQGKIETKEPEDHASSRKKPRLEEEGQGKIETKEPEDHASSRKKEETQDKIEKSGNSRAVRPKKGLEHPPSADPPKRQRNAAYQRQNGRYEGRYRPRTNFKLLPDEHIVNAYRGFENGYYKYEFLKYFDTAAQKIQWTTKMKADFDIRKAEAKLAFRLNEPVPDYLSVETSLRNLVRRKADKQPLPLPETKKTAVNTTSSTASSSSSSTSSSVALLPAMGPTPLIHGPNSEVTSKLSVVSSEPIKSSIKTSVPIEANSDEQMFLNFVQDLAKRHVETRVQPTPMEEISHDSIN